MQPKISSADSNRRIQAKAHQLARSFQNHMIHSAICNVYEQVAKKKILHFLYGIASRAFSSLSETRFPLITFFPPKIIKLNDEMLILLSTHKLSYHIGNFVKNSFRLDENLEEENNFPFRIGEMRWEKSTVRPNSSLHHSSGFSFINKRWGVCPSCFYKVNSLPFGEKNENEERKKS